MSKFLGYALHDLLRETGIFDPGTVDVEHVRIVARKGQRCRLMYRAHGLGEEWVEIDLAWDPLFRALIETGVLGGADYCVAFAIEAPREKVCKITYEYLANKEPLFVGLRAARIAQNAGEALVR